MGTQLGSEYKRGNMLDVKKENYGPETNVCHFSTPDYIISISTTLPEIKPSKMKSWDISSVIPKTSFNSH